jgi:hypothetical protein
VRGVIGFHYRKTTAEFHCAESGLEAAISPMGLPVRALAKAQLLR